ncbi:MAG: hypothetical protein JXB10_08820 [Pirellulales bacterium]|nr:hypothetical protein [Pirellulales bacterium]
MSNASTLKKCPLCRFSVDVEAYSDSRDIHNFNCSHCGNYRITKEALQLIDSAPDFAKKRQQLSSIVRRHYEFTGEPELITSSNYQELASQAPDKNDVPKKVRYLLNYIAHKSRFPGDKIKLTEVFDCVICFAETIQEFKFYIQYAIEAGFVEKEFVNQHDGSLFWLTTKGWEETRRIPTLESPYVFVAMSFSREGEYAKILTQAFEEAIKPAIEEDAGYQEALRVDRKEFLGDIVFEIIARIKESRFLVADATEHKNGVYFEAGYAMGMGLPVIWMCHKNDIERAHFDTRQLNHIVWDDTAELRKKLANRILATIGKGQIKAESKTKFTSDKYG